MDALGTGNTIAHHSLGRARLIETFAGCTSYLARFAQKRAGVPFPVCSFPASD